MTKGIDKKKFGTLAALHGSACFWCRRHLRPLTASRDHLIPLALGGRGTDNLRLACATCQKERSDITDAYQRLFSEGAARPAHNCRSGVLHLLGRWEALVRARLTGEPLRLCLHEILSVQAGKLTWEETEEHS